MITDLLASLTFYLVPYFTGRFFSKNPIQAWILGSVIWLVLFFLLNPLSKDSFQSIIRITAVSISVLSFFDLLRVSRHDLKKIQLRRLANPFFLLFVGSLVYFLVWKRNTPYPLQLNWDIYEHITLANLISKGNLSFFTTHISDTFTFNSYSPIFGVLLSIPEIIYQKSLIGIYWWIEYWHYILTILASYAIAVKIFKEKWMAFLVGMISALVFESLVVYSNLFLIPQTLVALLTIFVYLNVEKYKIRWLLIALITIILMHYIVGLICVAVLLFAYLSERFNISGRKLNKGIFLSTLALFSSIGINFLGKWHLLSIEEAQHFNFSLIEKLRFFTDWYGLTVFVFLIIGYLAIVKGTNSKHKQILIIALLILAISFAPFSYFLKFFVLGRYFLNLIFAAGIGVLLSNLPKLIRNICILFIGFVLLINFYINQNTYKEPLQFKNYETQISYGELEAGKWLSSYAKEKKVFLISDPGLQYILETVSSVDTQGGAYMGLGERKILADLKNTQDTAYLKRRLLQIEDHLDPKADSEVLVVLGGRYFEWQRLHDAEKESTSYNIWSPRLIKSQDKSYIDFIENSSEFEKIYENDELVIFKII